MNPVQVERYSPTGITGQVGDVNSNEKGSAARYNAGKPELQQIPLYTWWIWFGGVQSTHLEDWMLDILHDLGAEWQPPSGVRSGEQCQTFWIDMIQLVPPDAMVEAAQVLSYGASKYAQWNWTKGQAWNIPVGCMLRHLLAIAKGELVDDESQCTHRGHFVCNLLFLAFFDEHYPEGKDWALMPEIT